MTDEPPAENQDSVAQMSLHELQTRRDNLSRWIDDRMARVRVEESQLSAAGDEIARRTNPVTSAAPDPSAASRRDARQVTIHAWARAAFSIAEAESLPQRGLRLLEEAIEAFQATGGDAPVAHRLIDHVFERIPGDLAQEIGGVGICILALAAAAGCSADEAEAREVARVTSRPLAHFRERNAERNRAGFLLCDPDVAPDDKRSAPRDTTGREATSVDPPVRTESD